MPSVPAQQVKNMKREIGGCNMKFTKAILIVMIFASVWSAPSFSQTILQGGDNISNATPVPYLPFSDNGTTVGYTNDYT